MRTYSEMLHLTSLEDRFEYLSLRGDVGASTFGYDRYVNQQFYHSREWRSVRNLVIVRDEGFDMGLVDYYIPGAPQIHHLNPLSMEDFEYGTANLLDPEFLITVSHKTHNAIHYGDQNLLPKPLIDRAAGDTRLW